MNLGQLLSNVYTGETQVFCDLTDLTYTSPPLGSVHTQGLQSMIKQPSSLLFKQLGVHPTPNRMMTAMELRSPPPSAQAVGYKPTTLPSRDNNQSRVRKDMVGIHTKSVSHQGLETQVYAGTTLHKNSPSRPQWRADSPKFRETEKGK